MVVTTDESVLESALESVMIESSPSMTARATAARVRLANSAEGLVSGFLTGALGVIWAGWSTLKVNCMRLIVPG